jgi:integrase
LDGVYVSHVWRDVTRKAGVQVRFHDLRHAFATFALKGGVPVKVVSEILGHSTTAITENLYTAVLPGLKEDAVSAVASVLSQAMVSEALEVAK